ncbi:MAG: helix-turn-helix transcriptional regulator [Coprobacillaceae bacterium]
MTNMEHANAVTTMQEYMEQHLEDEITLQALAGAVGYSPWYCARMFKEFTGKSPFEYLRNLRLSKAAMRLRNEDLRVVDVAFDFLFSSHEGFTRAFQKNFGITPKSYQMKTPPIPLFHPYPVRSYYLMQQEKEEHPPLSNEFHVRIINFPARKLLLLRGEKADNYFDYSNEVGCDVWGMLVSVKEALHEPVGVWLPKTLRPINTSIYAQGVEVPQDYSGVIPENYDIIDLPPCTMMMFQGQPYDEDYFDEAIGDLSVTIDQYDPTVHGYIWDDDIAPRIQLEPQGYRGYIEGRPVKLIKQ